MFTITLICTAALPRIAGTIRPKNPDQAGMRPIEGRAETDSPADTGWATARPTAAPRPAPRRWPCPRCASDAARARARIPSSDAESHRAEVEKSGCQGRHAESVGGVQHAHGLRRQRDQQQEREHDARHRSRPVRICRAPPRNPGASRCTSDGREDHAQRAHAPTTMIIAVATRFARRAASSLLRVARYSVKVGTKALDSAPSANRSRVRLGMRKPSMNAS